MSIWLLRIGCFAERLRLGTVMEGASLSVSSSLLSALVLTHPCPFRLGQGFFGWTDNSDDNDEDDMDDGFFDE